MRKVSVRPPRRGEERRSWLSGAPPPRWVRVLPLGLGLADAGAIEARTVSLRPGDRLFLASDGVVEARDSDGAFYPLAERLSALADENSAALPGLVWADLVRFCPDVQDDVTMLVLSPAPPALGMRGTIPH